MSVLSGVYQLVRESVTHPFKDSLLVKTDHGFVPVRPGTNLAHTILDGADLTGANLENANLEGASLRGANLTRASFKNSNLTGADFTGATINNTDFEGAILKGVIGLPELSASRAR